MNLGGMMNGFSIELLNQSNHKVWSGNDKDAPTSKNIDALKKWRVTNAKAESILKISISHNLFDHIVNCKSACDIWTTLDGLFNNKDMARLHLLENELTNSTQEISLFDSEEPIPEARMK
ncbi:hypothetical protein AMTRI_Chr09g41630 [Amborella trichopoda]